MKKTIRKFKPNTIPKEALKRILQAGRLAPSGWKPPTMALHNCKKPETKRALAAAANNQMFIADADAVIVALGDPKA